MKSNIWTKTILFTYKYLDNIAGALDKLIDRQALNSYYYCGGNQMDNGVMAVADRIIKLSQRKIKLINIKVLVEQTLEKCDTLLAQLLIEKYVDNDKIEEIAKRHNLSSRTYFRRLMQAEDSFSYLMSLRGFNDEKLKDYLKDEKWIMEIYNKFSHKAVCEEKNEEKEIIEQQIC